MTPVLVALLAALPWGARAQDAPPRRLDDACGNEINLLCAGRSGRRLLECLTENRPQVLPACRKSIDAEADRLDKERDKREAIAQEAKILAARGEETETRLVKATGSVYLRSADMPEGRFVQAVPGMTLSAGDLVRTGADGAAELSLEGKSLVALAAGSDLTVDSLNPREIEFHLGLGRLVAKLAKVPEGRQLRFVTTTAAAAVRGAELVVEQPEGDRLSRVGVLDEGDVAVSAPSGGAEVSLGPHQETEVPRDKAPGPPKPLAALANAKTAIALVRMSAAQAEKDWKPKPPQARVAERLGLALKPALSAAALTGVAPGQQKRDYPEARRRQEELRERNAPRGKR